MTIHNKSELSLRRKAVSFEAGVWGDDNRNSAPDVIAPGDTQSFSAESDVFSKGAEGWVSYTWDGGSEFVIDWDVPAAKSGAIPFIDELVDAHLHVVNPDRVRGLRIVQAIRNDGDTPHLGLDVTVLTDVKRGTVTTGPARPLASGCAPAAVAWSRGAIDTPDRLDIFATCAEPKQDALLHKWFTENDGFQDWETIAGENTSLISGPATASWKRGRLDIFVVAGDGHLWHAWYEDPKPGWGSWDDLGGDLDPTVAPAAASWGANRIDIVARGSGGDLMHKWWDGSWRPWESLDDRVGSTSIFGGLGISSAGVNRLDIFNVNSAGQLQSCRFGPGGWTTWAGVSAPGLELQSVGNAPRGLSFAESIRVYALKSETEILGFRSEDRGSTWTQFSAMKATKGRLFAGVGVASGRPERVDLFALGEDGLHHGWSVDSGLTFSGPEKL